MDEKRYAVVDSSDRVLFGLAEVPPDHPAIMRISTVVPIGEIEVGRTVAGRDMCREEVFVKRVA